MAWTTTFNQTLSFTAYWDLYAGSGDGGQSDKYGKNNTSRQYIYGSIDSSKSISQTRLTTTVQSCSGFIHPEYNSLELWFYETASDTTSGTFASGTGNYDITPYAQQVYTRNGELPGYYLGFCTYGGEASIAYMTITIKVEVEYNTYPKPTKVSSGDQITAAQINALNHYLKNTSNDLVSKNTAISNVLGPLKSSLNTGNRTIYPYASHYNDLVDS